MKQYFKGVYNCACNDQTYKRRTWESKNLRKTRQSLYQVGHDRQGQKKKYRVLHKRYLRLDCICGEGFAGDKLKLL